MTASSNAGLTPATTSRKILALAEIYVADAVARAISDGLAFQAFSAGVQITNILETRARALPETRTIATHPSPRPARYRHRSPGPQRLPGKPS